MEQIPEDTERIRVLAEALASLPSTEQDVLSEWADGEPIETIAQVAGIRELANARKRVERNLKERLGLPYGFDSAEGKSLIASAFSLLP